MNRLDHINEKKIGDYDGDDIQLSEKAGQTGGLCMIK